MMRIIEWAEIQPTDVIPPFGVHLQAHLQERRPGGESYAAWNLLYRTMLKYGLEPVEVDFTSEGKPWCKGNSIYFSLAHTQGLCAVSISDVPTGIDVERADRQIPDKVKCRVFSPEEYVAFQACPVVGWCRKEAAAKIRGNGLLKGCKMYTIREEEFAFEEKYVDAGGVRYLISAAFTKES